MRLDSKQLRAIAARFRGQHALEIGAKGLFWGLVAAAVFILYDKIWPLSVTFNPGYYALAGGFVIGAVAGLWGLTKRFAEEEAARAVDAHYALKEQMASAKEVAGNPSDEWETALVASADEVARNKNLVKDFRLRPPRFSSHAGIAGAFALGLLFLPPLQNFFPERQQEIQDLKAREAQLMELSNELKEIKRDDEVLDELSKELEDLAVRAQKERLTKEEFPPRT